MGKIAAITGASGYIGRMLTERLMRLPDVDKILAIDIMAPRPLSDKIEFVKCDIRDKSLKTVLNGCDTVIHLAFVVTAINDLKKTYDINVNGTVNLLEACEDIGPRHLLVASSMAAYGRLPRNNERITEQTPLRGEASSYYMHSKRLVEEHLDTFEKRNPDVILTRLRPSVLLGPKNDNFAQEIRRAPIALVPREGMNIPAVHEEDAVDAFVLAFKHAVRGAFNISLPNPISFSAFARALGKPIVYVKTRHLLRLSKWAYTLRLSKLSPDWIVSGEGDWRIDISKAKAELGWEPKRGHGQIMEDMQGIARSKGS